MGKNQEYATQYAGFAMEQMRRYGIPASVTLAQGILESSNGQSELSRLGNNHFGIKATPSWLQEGGDFLVYTDDKPDEKFCKYASVGDSFEHHSRFLKENSRYATCFALPPDDYKGWTENIAKAGYATGNGYAKNLQHIIEANGLQKYDRQVMQEIQSQNKKIETASEKHLSNDNEYAFPLERKEFLFVTSPFGMRTDPMDKTKQEMHKGIDIRTNRESVLATESNGKVVAVNHHADTHGGKSVTVEYERKDGGKVQCSYMHLNEVGVKVGDAIRAGQKLGVSGNSGTRTTGEHLHFGVRSIATDGTIRDMDPAAYLAEIAQKGNIKLTALHNGRDLMAKYKTDIPATTKSPSSDEWIKKLLSSEDGGIQLSGNGDPLLDMAMTAFSSLMVLAVQIDNKSEEGKKTVISENVYNRTVDLTALLPGMKSCSLTISEKGKAILQADNGSMQIERELQPSELNRLSVTLNNPNLTEESKRMRVAGMVNSVILSQQASVNFEQEMSRQQERTENLRR